MLSDEIEALFINGWVCVGRADEVPEAGDYYTIDMFDEPLIIVRSKVNNISVLSNVCRHRGSQILKDNSKRFTCPHHRWPYSLDGTLLAAPLVDKTDGFDRAKCKLTSFRSHQWWGWLFVNLSGSADASESGLIGPDHYVRNYHPEQMCSIGPDTEHWPINRKCLSENFKYWPTCVLIELAETVPVMPPIFSIASSPSPPR